MASCYSDTGRLTPASVPALGVTATPPALSHLCTLMLSLKEPPGSQCYPPDHFTLTGVEGGVSQDLKIRVPYALVSPSPSVPLFCMLNITETYPSATRHQTSFSSHRTRQSFKRNLIELKLFVFYESRFIYLGQNRDILVNLKFTASFIANHPGARAVWLPEL